MRKDGFQQRKVHFTFPQPSVCLLSNFAACAVVALVVRFSVTASRTSFTERMLGCVYALIVFCKRRVNKKDAVALYLLLYSGIVLIILKARTPECIHKLSLELERHKLLQI